MYPKKKRLLLIISLTGAREGDFGEEPKRIFLNFYPGSRLRTISIGLYPFPLTGGKKKKTYSPGREYVQNGIGQFGNPMAPVRKKVRDRRQKCGLYALRWRRTGRFQRTCAREASAELPQTAARLRSAAPAGTQRSQRRNQWRMIPQVSRSFRCQLCFPPWTSYRSTSVESPSQR